MTTELVTFSPQTEMTDAIHELVRKEISGALVIDEKGDLVGILTERDCLKAFVQASYYAEPAGPVSEFMSREVKSVDADVNIIEIAQLLSRTKYRRYPVFQGDRLVGLISRRDILRALLEASFFQPREESDIM